MFVRIVKLAAVSIYSLGLFGATWPDCKPLAKTTQSHAFWKRFTDDLGAAPFPGNFSVCIGRSYFFEVKSGAKMASALDRNNNRILLRSNQSQLLIHEMAHLYLDLRWKILPYSISEPLVQAMAQTDKCELTPKRHPSHESIRAAWRDRANLSPCELRDLLRAILFSDNGLRETLPLR